MRPRVDIVIGAKTKDFAVGARTVKEELNAIATEAKKIPGVGQFMDILTNPVAAATGLMVAYVRTMSLAVAQAEKLREISVQIGGTRSDAQSVRYAGRVSGIGEDQLTSAMVEIRRSMGEALAGSREKRDALAELGISGESLSRLSTREALVSILKKFEGGGSARSYAAASKVVGGSLPSLLSAMPNDLQAALGGDVPFAASDAQLDQAESVGKQKRRIWANALALGESVGLYELRRNMSKLMAFGAMAANVPAAFGSERFAGIRDELISEVMLMSNPPIGGEGRLRSRLQQSQQVSLELSRQRDRNDALAFEERLKGMSPTDTMSALWWAGRSAVESTRHMTAAEFEASVPGLIRINADMLEAMRAVEEEMRSLNENLTSEVL